MPGASDEPDVSATATGVEDMLAIPTDAIASSDALSSSATAEGGELPTPVTTSDASSTSTGAEESPSGAAEDVASPSDI